MPPTSEWVSLFVKPDRIEVAINAINQSINAVNLRTGNSS